jgi:hypothetical protein
MCSLSAASLSDILQATTSLRTNGSLKTSTTENGRNSSVRKMIISRTDGAKKPVKQGQTNSVGKEISGFLYRRYYKSKQV